MFPNPTIIELCFLILAVIIGIAFIVTLIIGIIGGVVFWLEAKYYVSNTESSLNIAKSESKKPNIITITLKDKSDLTPADFHICFESIEDKLGTTILAYRHPPDKINKYIQIGPEVIAYPEITENLFIKL